MRHFLGVIAPLMCAAVAGVDALNAKEWQKQTIYQVVTDRFARASSNDSGLGIIDSPDSDADCPNPKQYCGGSWQGIIEKLDYIQGMGFTAIWISPVIENTENASTEYSYHGYWPRNFYGLNHHFGSEEDLIELSDALHSRGMYLMFDIVVNHVLSPGPQNATNYSTFTPFDSSKYFHRPCVMDNSNETSVQVCQLKDDKATVELTLPDINTEDPVVRDIFQEWIKDTVEKYNVDGLRLDTYKHVERDFWPGFIDAAGVFSLAEFLDGDPKNYNDELIPSKDEGVLNYPTFYWIRRIFQNPQTWMTELVQGVGTMRNGPINTNLLAPFLENHDEQRFASLIGDMALTKNALAFTLLFDGIPIIHQGQEQHFSGQNDPFNRERLWTSGYNEDSELYRWIAKLNAVRAHVIETDSKFLSSQADIVWPPQVPPPGNNTGNSTTSPTTTSLTNHHIAVKKGSLVSVLTNVGVGGDKLDVVLPRNVTKFKAGEMYVDLLSCETFVADRKGAISFEMGWLPRALYPATDAASSGLCLPPQDPTSCDAEPPSCLVRFNISTTTGFGQAVQILGDIPQLGYNDRQQAVTLGAYFYTSDNPLWSLTFELPAGKEFSYQYFKIDGRGIPQWDGGSKDAVLHSYTVPSNCEETKPIQIVDKWTGSGSNDTASPAARSVLSRGSKKRLSAYLWGKVN
ncbi:glycosylhydrolase family 13-2 [Diaporthe helianthi]|uniref:alpha-amylase n=1 Tax=Diaporthe helianthi TaxID=158607 RepID=A0A2P5HGH9_DIAHE|nr:glycosylhydrolase family 13-2 [Diaporthe helianthi]